MFARKIIRLVYAIFSSSGLFQKKYKQEGGSRTWSLQGYRRNSMWKFQVWSKKLIWTFQGPWFSVLKFPRSVTQFFGFFKGQTFSGIAQQKLKIRHIRLDRHCFCYGSWLNQVYYTITKQWLGLTFSSKSYSSFSQHETINVKRGCYKYFMKYIILMKYW